MEIETVFILSRGRLEGASVPDDVVERGVVDTRERGLVSIRDDDAPVERRATVPQIFRREAVPAV
ncbi:MAG TPA: hypothetical protein VE225_01840, partial [Rubrobacteraceae bacterium]|nr:hypothetical protein [Rubrobacteraceae bacterium]